MCYVFSGSGWESVKKRMVRDWESNGERKGEGGKETGTMVEKIWTRKGIIVDR